MSTALMTSLPHTSLFARAQPHPLKRPASPLRQAKGKRAKFSMSDDEGQAEGLPTPASLGKDAQGERDKASQKGKEVEKEKEGGKGVGREEKAEKVFDILPRLEWVPAVEKYQPGLTLNSEYETVNVSAPKPKIGPELPVASTSKQTLSPPPSPPSSPVPASLSPFSTRLHTSTPLSLQWPNTPLKSAPGLHNAGNTCFVNSILQPLLHTPPLIDALVVKGMHEMGKCRKENTREGESRSNNKLWGYCVACAMDNLMKKTWVDGNRERSTGFFGTKHMRLIVPHFQAYRQEDAHEFLRYTLDGMQQALLNKFPKDVEAKLRHQTFISRIFGGKLRSRVTCKTCGYNSDTYDEMMDVSLDVRLNDVEGGLRAFTRAERLDGQNKYKCDKCKKPVAAEKRFSIEKAPMVLTVHLKRFTSMGKKINGPVGYPERLNIAPYLSQNEGPEWYKLYAMTAHHGGSPNSGHYISYVHTPRGWVEFDDSSRTTVTGFPQYKNSVYLLYYLQERNREGHSDRTPTSSTPSRQNHHNLVSNTPKNPNPSFRSLTTNKLSSTEPFGSNEKKRKLEDGSSSLPPAKRPVTVSPRHPSILPPPTENMRRESIANLKAKAMAQAQTSSSSAPSSPNKHKSATSTALTESAVGARAVGAGLMSAAIQGRGGVALVDYEEEEDVGEKVERQQAGSSKSSSVASNGPGGGKNGANRPKMIDALKGKKNR
ncbi:cysteine proteinase [Atractiella rhizophila]|nr:cysteine proteinase [Atractiella rhizophila]